MATCKMFNASKALVVDAMQGSDSLGKSSSLKKLGK